MKKNIVFIVLCIMIVPVSVYAQIGSSLAVVRLYTTESISLREFKTDVEKLEKQSNRQFSKSERQQLLDMRINEILLLQAAIKAKVTVLDSEVEQALEQQMLQIPQKITTSQFRQLIEEQTGMSFVKYKETLRKNLLQQKYFLQENPSIQSSIKSPNDKEILSMYQQNIKEFVSPVMIRADYIVVDIKNKSTKEKQALRKKIDAFHTRIINGGMSVFTTIKNQALDDVQYDSGDTHYLAQQEPEYSSYKEVYGAEVIDRLFNLNKNDISSVLSGQNAYYIFYITDKREPKLLEIDDLIPGQNMTVAENVRQYIMLKQQEDAIKTAMEKITEKLRKKANIKINQKLLQW